MYRLITADGNITEKQRMSLKQMQDFVGGYVEKYKNVYCNEDGLRLKLPKNQIDPRFVGNIIEKFKSPVPIEYETRAGFAVGDLVHIDTDNKEWGRVTTDGKIFALFGKNALVGGKSIRADIIVPYKDIHKK